MKADYGNKAQVERDLLLEENKELKDKVSLLNDMNSANYDNFCKELKLISKLKDELVKDRMEQFDDYVIYLLTKYIDMIEE